MTTPLGTPVLYRYNFDGEQSLQVPGWVYCTYDSWTAAVGDLCGVPQPSSPSVVHLSYISPTGGGIDCASNVSEGAGLGQYQLLKFNTAVADD